MSLTQHKLWQASKELEMAKKLIKRNKKHRLWQYLIIHHSFTTDQKKDDWRAIKSYHVNTLKFKDIAYQFGVEREKGELVYRVGRDLSTIGAHSGIKGVSNMFNQFGIGICVVGNYDKNKPDCEILKKTIYLCKNLMYMFEIPRKYVLGHREIYKFFNMQEQKTCPGSKFDMEEFRFWL